MGLRVESDPKLCFVPLTLDLEMRELAPRGLIYVHTSTSSPSFVSLSVLFVSSCQVDFS